MKRTVASVYFYIFLVTGVTLGEIHKIPLKKISSLYLDKIHDHKITRRAIDNNTKKNKTSDNDPNNLRGQPGLGYYLEMGIGTPPQMFNILIDTGSSNFAVAAAPHQDVTHYFNSSLSSTYSYDGTEVYVPYTQGDWDGPLVHERVTIPSIPSLNITADIAFITDSDLFFQNDSDWQGILGLAYAEIVRPDTSIEVFLDTLKKQTSLEDLFSLQLCGVIDLPNQSDVNTGGSVIFGGIDDSMYRGELQYAPIYKEWYYEVIVTHISVNGTGLGLDCKEYNFDKTIVDSGTTNLRLPHRVFEIFLDLLIKNTLVETVDGIIPPEFWVEAEKLCWPQYKTPWQDFPSIVLQLAASEGRVFDLEISPQQYLREVDDQYDPTSTNDCYKFAVSPSESGTVLGAIVMEGFYIVFDRKNKRMGFAETTCQSSQPNIKPSKVSKLKNAKFNTKQCAYIKPVTSMTTLAVAAYAMLTLCILCLVPILLFLFQCQYHRRCRQRRRDDFMIDENNLLESSTDPQRC